jgi:hypothetical protein
MDERRETRKKSMATIMLKMRVVARKRFERHFGADFYRTLGEKNKSKFFCFCRFRRRKSRKFEEFPSTGREE